MPAPALAKPQHAVLHPAAPCHSVSCSSSPIRRPTPRAVSMSRRVSAARNRCLELERVIGKRARSGSLGLDDALKLLDELLPIARPDSVYAVNQLLTVLSRAGGTSISALLVSRFNRIPRVSSDKVTPDLCTYSILIGSLCRTGCLELSFSALGLILKTGWRMDDIVLNQVLTGLCDSKRVSEAMDVLLRRMPEWGCTPTIVSYSILLKGFCNERRVDEALELLHMMADDGGRQDEMIGDGCLFLRHHRRRSALAHVGNQN